MACLCAPVPALESESFDYQRVKVRLAAFAVSFGSAVSIKLVIPRAQFDTPADFHEEFLSVPVSVTTL